MNHQKLNATVIPTISVIPAKAGSHPQRGTVLMQKWFPAFAGMTKAVWMTCLLSFPLFALNTDKTQPIKINADTIDVKASEHKITYTGHVELSQGTMHLIADKAITIGDKNDHLSEAIVYGNAQSLAHAWAETDPNKPPMHIYADVIHYYPDKKLVTLVGHAKVVQGKNNMQAPKINYQIDTRQVTTESHHTGRTEITFFPEKKS